MLLDYDRIDPELKPALENFPGFEIDRDNVLQVRAMMDEMRIDPDVEVLSDKTSISTAEGEIDIYTFRKDDRPNQPAILWIHGGGYIMGSADDAKAKVLASECNCTVFSVEYRMAPEHPFPAGPEDCYAALSWLMKSGADLGIDTSRIVLGGASAGAGMAAGVALMNRDRDNFPLKLQLLLYPMIDNLHATGSGEITNHAIWNLPTSVNAWEMYLDGTPDLDASPYAAASRATDLSGLPPTYICVGTEDLFRDEDIDYARRISEAGAPCELAVFPGMYHAGESFVPTAAVSRRMNQSIYAAANSALE